MPALTDSPPADRTRPLPDPAPDGVPDRAPRGVPQGAPGAGSAQSVATTLLVRAGAEAAFIGWQAALTRAIGGQAGFLSVEFHPLFAGAREWRVIQRFHAPAHLDAWLGGETRRRLFDASAAWRDAPPSDEGAPDFHGASSVTEVVVTTVQPGQEAAFGAWCEAIQTAQGGFPGYMGTLVQAPPSDAQPAWTTLVRFATPAQLDAWLASPQRRDLLRRSGDVVRSWKSSRLPSSFAGWFDAGGGGGAAWKQAAVVLLVLFPAVMLELRYLSPRLAGWNPALATFAGNAISVALVTWPLAPLAIRCLRWWLQPDPARRRRTEALGLATIAVLYAIELGVFRHFL